MTKKANKQPANGKRGGQPVQFNRRFYWIRAALVTALVFIFVLWTRRETPDGAYLWASGFAAATLLYFVVSYYMLHR